MAHTSCPSGHSMWNGDGKPVVYAFRINFFKDFVKKYPYFQLGTLTSHKNIHLYRK